jgi:hypothetical protein
MFVRALSLNGVHSGRNLSPIRRSTADANHPLTKKAGDTEKHAENVDFEFSGNSNLMHRIESAVPCS